MPEERLGKGVSSSSKLLTACVRVQLSHTSLFWENITGVSNLTTKGPVSILIQTYKTCRWRFESLVFSLSRNTRISKGFIFFWSEFHFKHGSAGRQNLSWIAFECRMSSLRMCMHCFNLILVKYGTMWESCILWRSVWLEGLGVGKKCGTTWGCDRKCSTNRTTDKIIRSVSWIIVVIDDFGDFDPHAEYENKKASIWVRKKGRRMFKVAIMGTLTRVLSH